MAADEDLMKLMSKDTGQEPASVDAEGDGAPGPVGSAMSTPQQNEGAKMESTARISLAMKLLEQSMLPFGTDTKEGKAISDSIAKLQRTFGIKLDEAERLIPAELKMLVESAGMKTPEMQAAAGAGGAPGAPPMMMAA